MGVAQPETSKVAITIVPIFEMFIAGLRLEMKPKALDAPTVPPEEDPASATRSA